MPVSATFICSGIHWGNGWKSLELEIEKYFLIFVSFPLGYIDVNLF